MILVKRGYASLNSIVTLGAVIIVIIPMLVSMLFMYGRFSAYFNENNMKHASERCEQINLLVEKEMAITDNLLRQVVGSKELKEFLELDTTIPDYDHLQAYKELDKLIKNYLYVNRLDAEVLVFDEENFYSTGETFFLTKDNVIKEEWYPLAIERSPNTRWLGLTSFKGISGENQYFLCSRSIVDIEKFDVLGSILYASSPYRFDEILHTSERGENIFIISTFGELLFPSTESQSDFNNLHFVDNYNESSAFYEIEDRIVTYSNVSKYGFRTVSVFSRNQFLKESRYLRLLIVILFLLLITLFVSFVIFVMGKLIKPLQYMVNIVNRIEAGETHLQMDYKMASENLIITKGILSLAEKNSTIKEHLGESLKERKVMELSKVQAQVNPHFIYNTLTSIKYIALLNNQDVICTIITKFVNLLRNSINKEGDFIHFEDEVLNLKNYIDIQQIIHKNDIIFNFDIEEETSKCLVPNFILQPLVENSILHGILATGQKDGEISIKGWIDQFLYITVKDNGCGIDQDIIDAVFEDTIEKNKFTGIGIKGVDQKIKLLYEDDTFGLRINSKDKPGVTMTIVLPVNRLEEGSLDKSGTHR